MRGSIRAALEFLLSSVTGCIRAPVEQSLKCALQMSYRRLRVGVVKAVNVDACISSTPNSYIIQSPTMPWSVMRASEVFVPSKEE